MLCKLDDLEYPRYAHVKPEEPDILYLGGDLYGMNYTMKHFPDCIEDHRLFNYQTVDEFILEHIEDVISHETIHPILNSVDGEESADKWDNVDGFNELTHMS